jgi:heterodisulfide reductase subunit A
MATIKQAMLVKEHNPGSEVSVFYNDIRATGKGFQEFFDRAKRSGIRFIKSLPGEIETHSEGKRLRIQYEDLESFGLKTMDVDMVVLAAAMEPRRDSPELARLFRLDLDPWGFFQERHPSLAPIETAREGIYVAGTCLGPRDIPESVGQGSAVAAKICRLFHGRGLDE